MSTKTDASQGMVRDPKRPAITPVAKPDNEAQFRTIERGLDKPVPAKAPVPERNGQDWHRG